MFWKTLPTRVWLFGLFLIVALGAVFYFVLGREARSTITEQKLRQEQTIARAEASNIESFFQVFGDSVAVLAQLSSMESRNARTVRDMDTFVEQWRASDLVAGGALTDRFGVVEFNSNISGTADVGATLSDRDYFVWAKNQPGEGEYFVAQPVISRLGASEGQVIVPVASPVFRNGIFTGVLVSAVKLKPVTERFFGLIKISDLTNIFLVDEYGDLLFSSSGPDTFGVSIFEPLQGRLFFGSQTVSSSLENALKRFEEGRLQTETHIVAYSPIKLGTQNWLLIVSSPLENISDLTKPVLIRQTAMLLLASLVVLLFGIVAVRES